MGNEALYDIAKKMVAPGKGVLAADESTETMNKRLAAVGVEESPEMRRTYRQMLFTAPEIEQYLSGVILFDSSIRNSTDEGIPFPDILTAKGIIPGIKVDKKTKDLEGFPGEKVTQGLDDLAERLEEYHQLGARFAKWRAVITIDEQIPTDECIEINAVMMARYAMLCQAAGIVPMVEPEVLIHGSHSIDQSEEVTRKTIQVLFSELKKYRVDLRGVILKTSMVISGDEAKEQSGPEEVANATLRTLQLSVPKEVPGVVFLSGGQTPLQATENLQAIAAKGKQAWGVTYSYSRAIEEPILATWKGEESNVEKAQQTMVHRIKMNSLASKGEYSKEVETGK